MPEVTRVLLADSHTSTLIALREWLNPTLFTLLPQVAQTVNEAVRLSQEERPYILLIARHLLPNSPASLLDVLWGNPRPPLAERTPKLIILAGKPQGEGEQHITPDTSPPASHTALHTAHPAAAMSRGCLVL
ncbi:hypothetical protein MNBD_CHLOROFLEXI01-447 [hydrothermal vent metagenome]|uniref:Response regulatory domain-containing protein n=1 Tax=hydrothermal vent metagenome TaxID=652676 RepID=A0A3B0USZ5_9ZZZZ